MNDYWRKIFAWSISRQKLWDECKLAYFWKYVDKWEYSREHPFRKKLEALSALSGVSALQGSLIHDVLESQINQHRLGRPVDKDAARAQYLARLRDVQGKPERHITEVVNGQGVGPEVFQGMRDNGSRLLDNFFQVFWPAYKSLEYLEHEKFEHFTLDGKLEVTVKVDLVTRAGGMVVVTDWKTGQEREDHDEQVGIYILWASSKFGVPLSSVKAEVVYLDSCKQRIFEPDDVALQELRDMIPRRAEEMLQAQEKQDFPPDPVPWKCARCNYLTICEWGQQVVRPQEGSDKV